MFMAIDTLEYPELHDESIPTLAFIKSLNRLLVAAGIKDFNMQVCWSGAFQNGMLDMPTFFTSAAMQPAARLV